LFTVAVDRLDVDPVGRLVAGDAAGVRIGRGGDAGVRRPRLDLLAAVQALGVAVCLRLDVGRGVRVLVGVARRLLLRQSLLLPELRPPVLEPHLRKERVLIALPEESAHRFKIRDRPMRRFKGLVRAGRALRRFGSIKLVNIEMGAEYR
jgi:hypothetical protein